MNEKGVKIRKKPSTIEIISFGISCFALGFSIAVLISKLLLN